MPIFRTACRSQLETVLTHRFVESSKEGWFEWLSAWPAPAVQSLWDMYQYHMEFGWVDVRKCCQGLW